MQVHILAPDEAGIRLDVLVQRWYPGTAAWQWFPLFRAGKILRKNDHKGLKSGPSQGASKSASKDASKDSVTQTSDNQKLRPDWRLPAGATVEILEIPVPQAPNAPQSTPANKSRKPSPKQTQSSSPDSQLLLEQIPGMILWESPCQRWRALNKPKGLAVHPAGQLAPGSTLIEICSLAWQNTTWSSPKLIHRLDYGTSGLIWLAQNADAQSLASQALQMASKEYFCICEITDPKWQSQGTGICELPLFSLSHPMGTGKSKGNGKSHGTSKTKGIMGVVTGIEDSAGIPPELHLPAHTSWEIQGRWQQGNKELALLKVQIRTGRTHQIRVHLAHVGLPLWRDPDYNPRVDPRQSKAALFLHSHTLSNFALPNTNMHPTPRAPLPESWRAYLPQELCSQLFGASTTR